PPSPPPFLTPPSTLQINAASTTTKVVSSPTTSVSGQPVTFTATVSSAGGVPPDGPGQVTFTVDGTPFVVALSGGQASITVSNLSASRSPHSITAVYGDTVDGTFSGSSGSTTQTVTKADTTTVVSGVPNPSLFGQTVTFTATVSAKSPGTGTPQGTVQFNIDGMKFGSPVTLSGGTATITDSNLL